ncbi:alpha/beta fold hydrolase [Chondromyces crocatus]|uniref:AB hydrolase-1 domain-containing protein n=1 Tax=Chondromyces crocatus TaxID=52 RepID=A0A0K1EHG5_CHOCO|nr:alpha/beta hydrolase [Chondromyces crocatus]AKT40305.1 uncharacterized protein CMC5_044580 [Chondromyces crocatus]
MKPINERASHFESVHERKECAVGSHRWRYFVGKGSGDAVLLLTGGTRLGLGWLDLATALAPDHRTIVVDYPHTVGSFDVLAEGVLAILNAERISWVNVVGQSAGGMLAEILSRRDPQRTKSMVVSGSGLYSPEDMSRLEERRASIEGMNEEQFREATLGSLRTTWKDSADGEFWIAQIEATLRDGTGREGALNMFAAMIDLARRLPDLQRQPAWQGPLLVLKASDDPLITEAHTQHLVDLHPGCELRSFPTGGHSLLLTRPEEYIEAVRSFLSQVHQGH